MGTQESFDSAKQRSKAGIPQTILDRLPNEAESGKNQPAWSTWRVSSPSLGRREQFHQLRLAASMAAQSGLVFRTVSGLQAYPGRAGTNSISGRSEALGLIYHQLQQRAAALSYLDGFRIMAFLLLTAIPFVWIMKKPQFNIIRLTIDNRRQPIGMLICTSSPPSAAFTALTVPRWSRMTLSVMARPRPAPPDCSSRALVMR